MRAANNAQREQEAEAKARGEQTSDFVDLEELLSCDFIVKTMRRAAVMGDEWVHLERRRLTKIIATEKAKEAKDSSSGSKRKGGAKGALRRRRSSSSSRRRRRRRRPAAAAVRALLLLLLPLHPHRRRRRRRPSGRPRR